MHETTITIIFFSSFLIISFLIFIIVNQIKKRDEIMIMSNIDLTNYKKIEITYNQSLIQTSTYDINAHLYINESYLIIASANKSQLTHLFNYFLPLIIPKKQSIGEQTNYFQMHIHTCKIKTWKNNRITIRIVGKKFIQTYRLTITLKIKNDEDMQLINDFDIEHWC